jgi:archaellum component FlaF (FlaF/FlaG flagellin family)
MDNGTYARVKFDNLMTLSPETDKCCKSNGVDMCKGDKVWHPLPSTSIGVPEGKITRIFENCSAVVRDGLDYIYQMKQLGKSVDCSPQKESVCVGKIVYVEGYRNGKRYQLEGPVQQVFTNGTVLVKTGLWLLPLDATTAVVQTDSLHSAADRRPASAVITHRDGQQTIPVPTYPELEPYDANDAQRLIDRRGITYPIR